MTPEPGSITFRPWPNPAYDAWALVADSHYSRSAWLPTVGPTAWLLWGTIADQLTTDPDSAVSFEASDLAAALGIGSPGRHGWPLTRAMDRLHRFRLARPGRDELTVRVRVYAPPVSAASLRRLPIDVQRLHSELFGIATPT